MVKREWGKGGKRKEMEWSNLWKKKRGKWVEKRIKGVTEIWSEEEE